MALGNCSNPCDSAAPCCFPDLGPPETLTLLTSYFMDPTTAEVVPHDFWVQVPSVNPQDPLRTWDLIFYRGFYTDTRINTSGGAHLIAYESGAWNYGPSDGSQPLSDGWVVSRIPAGVDGNFVGQAGVGGHWEDLGTTVRVEGNIGAEGYYVSGSFGMDSFLHIIGAYPTDPHSAFHHFTTLVPLSFGEPQPPNPGYATAALAQASMQCRMIQFNHDATDIILHWSDAEIGPSEEQYYVPSLGETPTPAGLWEANSVAPAPVGPPIFEVYRVSPLLVVTRVSHIFWTPGGIDPSDPELRLRCDAVFRIKNLTCGRHVLWFAMEATGGVVTVLGSAGISGFNQPGVIIAAMAEVDVTFSWDVADGNTQAVSTIRVKNGNRWSDAGYDTIADIVTNHAPIISMGASEVWTAYTFGDFVAFRFPVSNVGQGATARLTYELTLASTTARIVDRAPFVAESPVFMDHQTSRVVWGYGYFDGSEWVAGDDPYGGILGTVEETNNVDYIEVILKKEGSSGAMVNIALTDGSVTYTPATYNLTW